jgi:hypothetical protein
MNTSDQPVIDHLEAALGPSKRSWDRDDTGLPIPVGAAEFEGPYPGAVTVCTVGLSQHVLKQTGHPHTDIRQELIWGAWARFFSLDVLSRLEDLAELAIGRRTAFRQGECRDFGAPVFPGSDLTGLCFSLPVWYPQTMAFLTGVYAEPIAFMWVLPISRAETEYASSRGWAALEELFAVRDPDMFDLGRQSSI